MKHYIIEGDGDDLVFYRVTRRALVELAGDDALYGYGAIFQSPTRRVPAGLRLEGGRVLRSGPGADFVYPKDLLGVLPFWLQWALGRRRFYDMVGAGLMRRVMSDHFAYRRALRADVAACVEKDARDRSETS